MNRQTGELNKAVQLVKTSHNISILPSVHFPEDSFPACLALFYSLRKLNKNVNLFSDNHPERFKFLSEENLHPVQADYLITIRENQVKFANLSYQKTDQGLNLFLKTAKGVLKPEDIRLKPLSGQIEDLLIAVGVETSRQAETALKEPTSPIINISVQAENEKYGEANLVSPEKIFSEIVFDLLCQLNGRPLDEQTANCLLAGIIYGTHNFQSVKTSPAILEKTKCLAEQGAGLTIIRNELYSQSGNGSMGLFERVLNKIKIIKEKNLGLSLLTIDDFKETHSAPSDLKFALNKITSGIFPFENFLLLWQQNSSPLRVKGVFYSPNRQNLKKVAAVFQGEIKGEGILFKVEEENLLEAKDKILEVVNN